MALKRFPDHQFFLGIVLIILPQWNRSCIKELLHQKTEEKMKLLNFKEITIESKLRGPMELRDFESKGK